MRHYPNKVDFDQNPTREALQNALVIAAGSENFQNLLPSSGKITSNPIICACGGPTMDYWSLKWDAIASERHRGSHEKTIPPVSK